MALKNGVHGKKINSRVNFEILFSLNISTELWGNVKGTSCPAQLSSFIKCDPPPHHSSARLTTNSLRHILLHKVNTAYQMLRQATTRLAEAADTSLRLWLPKQLKTQQIEIWKFLPLFQKSRVKGIGWWGRTKNKLEFLSKGFRPFSARRLLALSLTGGLLYCPTKIWTWILPAISDSCAFCDGGQSCHHQSLHAPSVGTEGCLSLHT